MITMESVFFILYFMYAIIQPIIILLFYMRKEKFPIICRDPKWVITSGCLVWISIHSQLFYNKHPCIYDIITGVIGIQLAIFCYVIRAWFLLFRFNISREVSEYNNNGNIGFYIRNRWLMKFPFLLIPIITLVVCLTFIIMISILNSSYSNEILKPVCSKLIIDSVDNMNIIMLTIQMLIIIIISCAIKSDSKVCETIKNEFLYLGWYSVIYLGTYLPIRNLMNETQLYEHIIKFSFVVMHMIFAFIYPLLLSFIKTNLYEDNIIDLSSFLKVKNNFDIFMKFLRTEFSSENLLFWKSVNMFESYSKNDTFSLGIINNTGEYKVESRKTIDKNVIFTFIMEKYIISNSYLQINISDKNRQFLENNFKMLQSGEIQNIDLNIFKDVKHEVYKLMENDSFPRFITSRIYNDYIIDKSNNDFELNKYSLSTIYESSVKSNLSRVYKDAIIV